MTLPRQPQLLCRLIHTQTPTGCSSCYDNKRNEAVMEALNKTILVTLNN